MGHKKVFVTIAGNIGSGKTSLTGLLSRQFGWQPYYESVEDNPYLEDFYKDMKRWAFPTQVFFLNHRFQVHRGINLGKGAAIQDRSIYEDVNIFVRNLYENGHMDGRDYQNCRSIFSNLVQFLEPPDLMVYLKKSLPRLKEGILKRGREWEKGISDEYLVNLNNYYDEWIEKYDLGKKVTISSDNLDFVNNSTDLQALIEALGLPK